MYKYLNFYILGHNGEPQEMYKMRPRIHKRWPQVVDIARPSSSRQHALHLISEFVYKFQNSLAHVELKKPTVKKETMIYSHNFELQFS